ncbi:hypothetical protein AAur_pTC20275 (plasmid) [Paenarthrobacter aurescens TC1]|uniref:Uncharacterized protein n=1 Tax=Paenarthrobacter aurescens (strain TC1) TaxID=290340 RepID=A1RDV8_PAEAT|nr:hypothetical protein AAur_pTC20275 [Paenarthrobacter aurescens TC1]
MHSLTQGCRRRDVLVALEPVFLVVSDQYQIASGLISMLASVYSMPEWRSWISAHSISLRQ